MGADESNAAFALIFARTTLMKIVFQVMFCFSQFFLLLQCWKGVFRWRKFFWVAVRR